MARKKVLTNEQKQMKWTYNHIKGDIFDLWEKGNWIAIPTNGDVNNAGLAVMGAGLAQVMARYKPDLRGYLGRRLSLWGNHVQVFPSLKVVTVPTKHHWEETSDVKLIERSLAELDNIVEHSGKHYGGRVDHVFVPRIGCGYGGLEWKDVEPLVAKWLGNSSKFTVVSLPKEYEEHYGRGEAEQTERSGKRRRSGDADGVTF